MTVLNEANESAFDYDDADNESEIFDAEETETEPESEVEQTEASAEEDTIENDFDYDDDEDEEIDEEDVDADESSSDDDSQADESSSQAQEETEKISNEMLFEAAQAGLPFDKVSEIKDPAALRMVIDLAKQGKSDDGQDASKEKADEPVFEFTPIELPEDFDEEVAEEFKPLLDKINPQMQAMAELINKQDKALRERDAAAEQKIQEVAQQEFYRWYDGEIEQMEDWSDVFGKGNIDALEQESDAAQNRIKLVEEMERQLLAHPEMASNRKKLLDMSMQITFPKIKQEKESAAKKRKTDNYIQTRTTNKPSGKDRKKVNASGKTKKKARATALATIKKYFGR